MEPPPKPISMSLFQVYLRLRPSQLPSTQALQPSLYPQLPQTAQPERFLTVEAPSFNNHDFTPTHITVHPLNDSRKRAVEKFAFTKVFEEDATQLDIFKGTGAISLIEGVLAERRDGLLATLGVTGSGKVEDELLLDQNTTNIRVDSYHFRLKDTKGTDTAIPRSIVSVTQGSACRYSKQRIVDNVSECCRCLRSVCFSCFRFPGWYIWRRWPGTWYIEDTNANNGRPRIFFVNQTSAL